MKTFKSLAWSFGIGTAFLFVIRNQRKQRFSRTILENLSDRNFNRTQTNPPVEDNMWYI